MAVDSICGVEEAFYILALHFCSLLLMPWNYD